MCKQNWFNTLNEALNSEGLIEDYPFGLNIGYGETVNYTFDNGTKYGHYVTIFRNSDGRYERPVHYNR